MAKQPKTVWNRTSRDINELKRTARIGDVYYGTVSVATNLAPYEDPTLWTAFTVTHYDPFFRTPMNGSMGIDTFVERHGPVSTEPPAGLRGVGEEPPQVAGPLPKGKEYDRDLTADAYGGLEDLRNSRRRDERRPKPAAAKRGWSW